MPTMDDTVRFTAVGSLWTAQLQGSRLSHEIRDTLSLQYISGKASPFGFLFKQGYLFLLSVTERPEIPFQEAVEAL